MKIYKTSAFVLLVGVLLASCAQASLQQNSPMQTTAVTPSVSPATTSKGAPEQPKNTAVDAALAELTKATNISVDQIKISAVDAVDWPNACLGAQKADEMCADVITPGYRVVLEAGGKSYEYHTNQDGSQIRAADAASTDSTPAASLPAPQRAAQDALAKQLGVAVDTVSVVSSEAVDWRDGCLEIVVPGLMCTQVITPGYRVILDAGGKQYEFHTNENGSTVMQANSVLGSAVQPKMPDQVIMWKQTENNVCNRVEIGSQHASYGLCDGSLKEAALGAGRVEELTYLFSTYQSFSQDTKAGAVEFTGMGQKQPTPAEMRSIAEWSQLVFSEAQSGRSGAAWGSAFAWHREGGFAGFCDDLVVYRTGWAAPSSCKGGQNRMVAQYRMTSTELEQMYTLLDQLASFDYENKDSATADAMVVKISFMGTGKQAASLQQQADIATFAAGIYANAANK